MVDRIGGYSTADIMRQEAYRKAQLYASQTGTAKEASNDESIMQKSAKGCTDGKDDGRIGFWKATGKTLKGALKFVGGLVGFDNNGNWSAGRLLKNVAIGAGVAALCVMTAGTAIPAIIAAGSAFTAGMGLVSSAVQAHNATTDEECAQAFESVGANSLAFIGSLIGYKGAKASQAARNGSAAAPKLGLKESAQAGWDKFTGTLSKLKTGKFEYVKTSAQKSFNKNWNIVKDNWKTVKSNWKSSGEAMTVEGTQSQKIASYESKIQKLNDTISKTKDAKVKAKLTEKVTKLTQERDLIKTSYNDINKITSFEEAQRTISFKEAEIAKLQRKLPGCKDAADKAKLTEKISNAQKQLEVYQRVTNQKVSQARNLRAEIDRINKMEEPTPELIAKAGKLEKQLDDMKFKLPERSQHKTYSEEVLKSSETLIEKQNAYNKAKAELKTAKEASSKYKADDVSAEASAAREALRKAKIAENTAAEALDIAKLTNNVHHAYSSASSGADYTTSALNNVKRFGKTVNKTLAEEYGTVTPDILPYAGRKIPYTADSHVWSIAGRQFGKYTVPSVAVPKYAIMLGSDSWVNPTGTSSEALMMSMLAANNPAIQIYNSFSPEEKEYFDNAPQVEQQRILQYFAEKMAS